MARGVQSIKIKVLVSFDDIRAGDEGTVLLTPRVQGWINAGFVKVVPDGKNQARPRRPEPDPYERVTARAEGSRPASGEPGESAGSGEHGAAEGFDPS